MGDLAERREAAFKTPAAYVAAILDWSEKPDGMLKEAVIGTLQEGLKNLLVQRGERWTW